MSGDAVFAKAKFGAEAWFQNATFSGDVWFDDAMFAGNNEFDGARVAPNFRHVVLPTGWITSAVQSGQGEEEGWLYVVRDQGSTEQPTEATDNGES